MKKIHVFKKLKHNEGIAGIAPNCRIMPIRVFNTGGSGITPQRLADAINFARQNGAHIISNSWGYGSGATNPNLHPVICDAIIAATTQGRNGLGCIVVFSASNSANHVNGNNGEVRFPSNVNVAGVLTVGASDRDDLQANYSPTSNRQSSNNQIIDLVAPSHRAYSWQIAGETWECWSIDIPGNPGYNPVKNTDGGALPVVGTVLPNAGINFLSYTGRFGGTSYSCPQVAAVAALVLSINPNLTQLQVFDILTTTADRVGGYVYTNGHSNELGFGRLNACRAVTQAVATLPIAGPTTICSTNSTFTINNLPTGITVSWSHDPNLLTYVSGQGTNNYVVKARNSTANGSGWVQATINSTCDSIQLPPKSVWVGTPSPSQILGPYYNPGMNSVCKGLTHTVAVSQTTGVTSYQWRIIYPDGFSWPLESTRRTATFCIDDTGWYTVAVKQRMDGCSWSSEITKNFPVENCGTSTTCSGGGLIPRLLIAPNPASVEITISEVEPTNVNIPWVLRLMSQQGAVLVNVTTTLPKSLSVAGLQAGVYVLHARRGQFYEQQIVIIE